MKFAPKPENDFGAFIRSYYLECRARVPRIDAIAGKWMFRDLIPGMSDFDTRFIVNNAMDTDDWCRMSMAVGEAHLALCRRYPAWARNLEHLPGINLTWEELTSARTYYPEYQQWSFHDSEVPEQLSAALAQLGARPWDVKDEFFHVKKFCLYYGRYDRQIDPAVNLGVHENKYPLHSRLMHYFTPPVHSAVCVIEQRHIVGKFDALERAAQLFPELRCWEPMREILHAGYETPGWYVEPALTELEDMLEEALAHIAQRLREAVTIVPPAADVDIGAWKQALKQVPMDPTLIIFDNAKFSRLMKGRLHFYAHAPAAWFDATWPIQNELRRIGSNFFVQPFRVFWQLRTGESVDDPAAILDELRDVLTDEDVAATRAFHKLTPGTWEAGRERETALAIAEVFDGFFAALTKISRAAVEMSA